MTQKRMKTMCVVPLMLFADVLRVVRYQEACTVVGRRSLGLEETLKG